MLAMRRHAIVVGLALLGPVALRGQAPVAPPPRGAPTGAYLLRAGRLIDGVSDRAREGVAVLVVGERITAVGPAAEVARQAPADVRVVDLGTATLLPGLIDNHTHILLQGDVTAADYDEQLLKESTPYRAIRATAAVRPALLPGLTRPPNKCAKIC
ncbi:MAG: hypothetical protein NVS1B4_19690 [Gemmatimonadaceae bacterium]